MPLALKPGVSLDGCRPEILSALAEIVRQYETVGKVCTVTAGTDGVHMPGSLHYKGFALDIRSRDLNAQVSLPLQRAISKALGARYDFVVESDHFHVEYDPKTPQFAPDRPTARETL
jgi:hypothetical protein